MTRGSLLVPSITFLLVSLFVGAVTGTAGEADATRFGVGKTSQRKEPTQPLHAFERIPFKRALTALRHAARQRHQGSSLGTASFMDKVVGGTPVSHVEDFPYYVLLDAGGAMCGGSLIGSNLVLTAAHCIGGSQYNAYIGALDVFSQEAEVIRAIAVAVHPDYNSFTLENDIAVIMLESHAQFTSNFAIPSDQEPPQGTDFAIMGFGTTSSGGSISDTFLEATVVGMDHAECSSVLPDVDQFSMLCASESGLPEASAVDTCQGDSGGPMVLADDIYQQVGIVSWGIGCAGPTPGVYTRVSSYVGEGRFLQSFLDGNFDPEDYLLPTPRPEPEWHMCDDGGIIPGDYFCDGTPELTGHPWPADCQDGSDEGEATCCAHIAQGNASDISICTYAAICNLEVPEGLCGEYCGETYAGEWIDCDEFTTCDNGQLLFEPAKCDGSTSETGHFWQEDCIDGSDEGIDACCPLVLSGNASEWQTCVYAQLCGFEPPEGMCSVYCDNGAYMGVPEYVCDGEYVDCLDGSDEANCFPSTSMPFCVDVNDNPRIPAEALHMAGIAPLSTVSDAETDDVCLNKQTN